MGKKGFIVVKFRIESTNGGIICLRVIDGEMLCSARPRALDIARTHRCRSFSVGIWRRHVISVQQLFIPVHPKNRRCICARGMLWTQTIHSLHFNKDDMCSRCACLRLVW